MMMIILLSIDTNLMARGRPLLTQQSMFYGLSWKIRLITGCFVLMVKLVQKLNQDLVFPEETVQYKRSLQAMLMRTKKTGFTLIELLVVVSLIGILATLVLANLNAARQRGRDAQRKADFRNIQTALRLYYNDYGVFPTSNNVGQIIGCGTQDLPVRCVWGEAFTRGLHTYMATLPNDSLSDVDYAYARTDPDNYTLTTCLENASDEAGEVDLSCDSDLKYEVSP